jgi:hypothetical protein
LVVPDQHLSEAIAAAADTQVTCEGDECSSGLVRADSCRFRALLPSRHIRAGRASLSR